MSNVKWEDGAVCFANKIQHFYDGDMGIIEKYAIAYRDFQLNEIRVGDELEVRNLGEYDKSVSVLSLFGFEPLSRHAGWSAVNPNPITVVEDGYGHTCHESPRKITYPQLMVIGKLKRAMIERDNALIDAVENTTILSDALNGRRSESHSEQDTVNNPSHYQFFEGVEVIEIIASSMTREQFKGYCLGNRMKYRLRAGNKDKLEQDIAKSDKYVELYDEHKHLCRIDGDLK